MSQTKLRPKSEILKGSGKMWQIWQAIVNALLAIGGGDEDLQRFLEEGSTLAQEVAKVIMSGKQKVRETYTVMLDCTMLLSEMIKHCDCEFNNPDINGKNFPIKNTGKQFVDLVLISAKEVLDWLIAQGQIEKNVNRVPVMLVIAFMMCHGFTMASIEHLLTLGIVHPDVPRKGVIIALGSVLVHPSGRRDYPFLERENSNCRLELTYGGAGWDKGCYFLVVRNK